MTRPRRSVLRLLGAGVVGLAGCADDPATTPPATERPSATPTETNVPTETPAETESPTEEPTPTEPPPRKEPDWTFDTRGDVQYPPTEAEGVLYVPSGSGADALFALDAADGTERWRRSTDHPPASKPVVRDAVYFETWSSRGTAAMALETDGSRRWRYVPENVEGVTRLELLTLGPNTALLGGSGHHGYRDDPPVFAVDRATGAERWRRTVTGPDIHRMGQTVYVDRHGGDSEPISAIDLVDGATLWERPLDARVVGTSGDLFVVADRLTGTVSARSLAAGVEQWSARADLALRYVVLDPDDERAYLVGDDVLAARSLTDGSERWRTAGYGTKVRVQHVADGTLYFAADGNYADFEEPLVAVDGATGEELWMRRLGYNVHSMDSRDGALYTALNEQLEAFGPAGNRRWRFDAGSDLSHLALGPNAVYAGDADGIVYGLLN